MKMFIVNTINEAAALLICAASNVGNKYVRLFYRDHVNGDVDIYLNGCDGGFRIPGELTKNNVWSSPIGFAINNCINGGSVFGITSISVTAMNNVLTLCKQ